MGRLTITAHGSRPAPTAMVLGSQPDIEVAGEAADGRAAVRLARECPADVMVSSARKAELAGEAYLMTDVLVQYSVDRGIARIALDSPRNRNALSAALVDQLNGALGDAEADETVRAVELTHTGSTFCAGADLTEARAGGMQEGTARLTALLRRIVALGKPVVGSIDGHVRAGGLGLVGACDIVLAGPASTFAFTEVRLGLAPAMISLTTLPRLDPRAASRYFLTGETFDAATAARIGLITEAVDDIDAGTLAVLDALRSCSPQGLRETKPLLTATVLDGFDARASELASLSARLFGSAEAAEGMSAFLAKRPPSWLTE